MFNIKVFGDNAVMIFYGEIRLCYIYYYEAIKTNKVVGLKLLLLVCKIKIKKERWELNYTLSPFLKIWHLIKEI